MFGFRGHAKFDVPSPTSRLWPPASAVNHGSQACPGLVHLLLCVSQRGLLQFSPLCKDRSWAESMSSGAVCVAGKGQASQNFGASDTPVCFSQAASRRLGCSFLFSRVAGGRLVGGCDVLTYFPVLALVRWDVYLLTTNRPPQGGAQNFPTPAARTRPTPTNPVCHKLCSGFSGTRAVFPNQRGGNTEHGNTEHGTHP